MLITKSIVAILNNHWKLVDIYYIFMLIIKA